MAKAIAIVASSLFVLALASTAYSKDLELQGQIYCDTCHVFFQTKLSTTPKDAVVQLTCRHRDTGVVTYQVKSVTGINGNYSLPVKGDHEDEVCEVNVVSNPDPDCNEISDEIDSLKVSLTKNTGIDSPVRFANPIGFVRKVPLPGCTVTLKKMGYELFDGKAPEDESN